MKQFFILIPLLAMLFSITAEAITFAENTSELERARYESIHAELDDKSKIPNSCKGYIRCSSSFSSVGYTVLIHKESGYSVGTENVYEGTGKYQNDDGTCFSLSSNIVNFVNSFDDVYEVHTQEPIVKVIITENVCP